MGTVLLVLLIMVSAGICGAAEPTGSKEYATAMSLFEDHHFGPAERAFADLLVKHPQTSLRPQVILYQARSRFNQGNYAGGLDLLSREEVNAGDMADRYRYFIGQGFLDSGQYREAAAAFASLRNDFPNPTFALDSYQGQATALAEAGDWPAVSELLLQPDGDFLKKAESVPEVTAVTAVVQCFLLAAEAEIRNGRPESAIGVLNKIAPTAAKADLRWKKQLLQARAEAAAGRDVDLVATSSNLVDSAKELRSSEAIAEAALFQGRMLAAKGRVSEAVGVWEGVLSATNGPAEPRREALTSIVQVMLNLDDLDGAQARLDRFLTTTPNDPASDAARLVSAEIRLRQSVSVATTNASAAATMRATALTNLQAVTSKSERPVLVGRAWLQIGWVHWLDGRFAEARTGFGKAVDTLPRSEDATVAAFKTGDCELALGHPQAALDIYRSVEERLAQSPGGVANLLDELEFQRMRAALSAGNLSEAEQAVTNLAGAFATSDLTARATVLLGVGFSRSGRLEEARRLMEAFVAKNPESPYRDQAELVVARSLDRQKKWTEAAQAYTQWLASYASSPLRPKVEYLRADATYRSGEEAAALKYFADLASERKDTEESVLAENWLATYYWNGGKFADAQKHYQRLYDRTNCPPELAFQARMMAGRAAFASSEFKAARDQFTYLIGTMPRTNPPIELAEVYFALGDTIARQLAVSTNSDAYYEAIGAFQWITGNFSNTPIAAAALGRLGEIHLEIGTPTQNPDALRSAGEAFERAMAMPRASRTTVQLATVRLGMLRELEKRPVDAVDLYLKVVYSVDDNATDPYWAQEAGLKAARLLEVDGKWDRLVRLYERLLQLVPAMRSTVEPRLADARIRLAAKAG